MAIYFDLSHPLSSETPHYPGDEALQLEYIKTYTQDGYALTHLSTGFHLGTHLDAPAHLSSNAKNCNDFSVEHFIGTAKLIDVRGQSAIKYFSEYEALLCNEDIVIIYTGWDRHYGKPEYYTHHPIIEEDFAQLLIRKKIKLLGMDMPSPDQFPFLIHQQLLSHNVLILENLKGLDALLPYNKFCLIALPLNIKAEGSFVRAVACID